MMIRPVALVGLAWVASISAIHAQPWSIDVLPQGLAAWWAAEGNARDSTTNHHDGAVSEGVNYSTGRFGSAFAFDGTGGVITVADNPLLRMPEAVSIEFWAKRQRDGIDIVLEKGGDWNLGGEANYGVGLHHVNNRMFYFFFMEGWRGTSGVADFAWHHYVVTATNGASQPALYIDGAERPVEFGAGAATIQLFPSARPLHIGAQISPGWNYYGNNVLDDIRLYNRQLSPGEVSYLYEGAKLQIRFATPDSVALRWPTLQGKTYQLQSTDGLGVHNWINEGLPLPGTGGLAITNLPSEASGARFFRLELAN